MRRALVTLVVSSAVSIAVLPACSSDAKPSTPTGLTGINGPAVATSDVPAQTGG